jgi:hypothetical protein
MAEVSGRALMMAVQAVQEEIRQIREQLEEAEGEQLPELEELLLAFSDAAEELRVAYLSECEKFEYLPPYSDLVN